MKLKDYLDQTNFDALLYDASGVIYSDNGIIEGATDTIAFSQSVASTYLVTNNSYSYPNYIHDHLKNNASITINEPQIISSGHGLATDPKILDIISDKNIYFLGRDQSLQYILDAPIKSLVNSPDKAEVIILANYTPQPSCKKLDTIINTAIHNPHIPVICCNPDIKIRSGKSLLNVMGYYAKQIEDSIPQNIYWYGKPYKNFSDYVAFVLNKQNIEPSKKVMFFDDNIQNVVNMQNDIGISGCWVKNTGIYYLDDSIALIEKYGIPTATINSINLNSVIKLN